MTDVDPGRWLQGTKCNVPRVLALWDKGVLADVPAGHDWDIVRLPQTAGLAALSVIHGRGHPVGPVMLTSYRHTVDVLVDAGAAARWKLPGTFAFGHGSALHCPHPDVVVPWSVGGSTWLVPPDGTGTVTDADELRLTCRNILNEPGPYSPLPAEAFG